MRISDWSSDVCSSDLVKQRIFEARRGVVEHPAPVKVRLYGRPERATKLTAKRVDRSSKNSSRKPSRVVILCLLLKKRSADRCVGKECVSEFSSRCWPYDE